MTAVVQIAVVDDEESMRTALRRFLGGHGFEVITFASGEEFLGWLSSHRPDCAVLDVHMPGLNGLEVQDRLAGAQVPVPCVVISSDDEADTRERALAAGAAAFVRKSAPKEELLSAIRTATKCGRSPPPYGCP
jgi:FixJ family two-component response regulator